jgi:hypothetical protein
LHHLLCPLVVIQVGYHWRIPLVFGFHCGQFAFLLIVFVRWLRRQQYERAERDLSCLVLLISSTLPRDM